MIGRTGLILRQWVDRDGCYVLAKQAYAYDTGAYITSHTEVLCVFKFHNEWRAALCEARMNNYKWEARERAWRKYFSARPKLSWWQYEKELILKEETITARLAILIFIVLVLYLCLR